jgi:hypothetical protein
MKFRVLMAAGLLTFASVGMAEDSMGNANPTPTPTPTATPTPTPTPRPGAKKAPATMAKKKEEPPIEGMAIQRSTSDGQLGFNFVGNNIVLTFFDAKRKKVPVNVTRAIVRWEMKRKTGTDQTVLNSGGDSFSLTSAKIVQPPHNLRFTLLLFVEGKEEPVESYTVMYQG